MILFFPMSAVHPKVKLFISHGGISGVYEAVDAGVPILGFPLFYDQPRNVGNLVDAGMALSMDLLTITKDSFLRTIRELISNKTYDLNLFCLKNTTHFFLSKFKTRTKNIVRIKNMGEV